MNTSDEKKLKEFTEELAHFLIPAMNKYQDPLMVAACMLRMSMGLYTSTMSDDEIYHLLDVVSESIPEIRSKAAEVSEEWSERTLH